MSTASHDSSTEYGLEPILPAPSAGGASVGGTGIWLDGGVLACRCPDCGAPMSIRLWLMVADCFRCGTSLELTEEQEQEVLRLLREQEETKRRDSREAAAAISPSMLRKPRSQPEPVTPRTAPEITKPAPAVPGKPPAAAPARERPRRVAASEVYRGARARVRDIYERGGVTVFLAGLFEDLPAWLISAVFHIVVLLLLALWFPQTPGDSDEITLSTAVSALDEEGDQIDIDETELDAFEFEDPGGMETVNVIEETGVSAEEQVDLDAVEPNIEVPNPVGNVPDFAARPPDPVPTGRKGHMFAGRNPEARAESVRAAGGTSLTEAAVARGLTFLARHQSPDGSWSLREFHKTADCDQTCKGQGSSRSPVAATALSLLPFLGAGQTHHKGQYCDEVFRGLKFLLDQQKEDGDLRDGGGRMYAHGQAAIALCEAYALTGDDQLRGPAQKAINFIVRAQHEQGGWRYVPKERGDTSVVGWQLMALKSGQMSYLHVPAETFELAGFFLDDVKTDKPGGLYTYQRGRAHTPTMTAEALLCRQYLGWRKDQPGLRKGVHYLLENLPDNGNPNVYYWYYATQVVHHYGSNEWSKWNAKMRQLLVDTQEKEGHAAGSWAPRGEWSSQGGRIFMTSLAICILEVYYRHMPIYQEQALESFE